jgi:hypothetical protein
MRPGDRAGGEEWPCPICGEACTQPAWQMRDEGTVTAVVMTDLGTWWPHLRDTHPAAFAEACERRRRANATVAYMPRNIAGAFLHAGKDVGDL